jgi:hypothetical protein
MSFQRSDQQRGSRYSKGGISEIKGNRLAWWERKVFPRSHADIPLTISAQYHLRPDLLAAALYGRDSLQWFILQYNNINDIHTEFVQGAVIVLPTRARLFGELLSSST